MSVLDVLILLVVAAICGSVGRAVAGRGRGGVLVSIAVGFVGAWIGLWIARAADLPPVFVIHAGGAGFPVVWSIVGGALFVAVVGILRGHGVRS